MQKLWLNIERNDCVLVMVIIVIIITVVVAVIKKQYSSVRCLLDAGYTGDGVNCRFVGLCAVNNGGCHPMAVCRETPGK